MDLSSNEAAREALKNYKALRLRGIYGAKATPTRRESVEAAVELSKIKRKIVNETTDEFISSNKDYQNDDGRAKLLRDLVDEKLSGLRDIEEKADEIIAPDSAQPIDIPINFIEKILDDSIRLSPWIPAKIVNTVPNTLVVEVAADAEKIRKIARKKIIGTESAYLLQNTILGGPSRSTEFMTPDIFLIEPSSGIYAFVLKAPTLGEPLSYAEVNTSGDAVVVIVQESPGQFRIKHVSNDPSKMIQNAAFISDMPLRAAAQVAKP